MKTFLMTAVAALLLGSAGFASAAPNVLRTTGASAAPLYRAFTSDSDAATFRRSCYGYGSAVGSMLCETATGGPVGGIN